MLSGVGLCTSEQPDPHCAACTADLLALRFCGTSSVPAKSEIGPAEFEIYLAKSEADFARSAIDFARCEIDLARCAIDFAISEIDFARCEIGHADVKFYQGCLLAVHSPPYAVRFPP